MGTSYFMCQLLGRETTFGLPVCFFTIKPIQRGIYSLRKEFAPRGANSFLLELTLIEKRGKKENSRVASPESQPIDL